MLRSSHYQTQQIQLDAMSPYASYTLANTPARIVQVSDLQQRKFIGDFYGLLKEFNVSTNMWTLHLIANKLMSPGEYNGESIISIIQNTVFEQLINSQVVIQKR